MCYSRAGKSAKHKARSHRDVSDVTEQSAENTFLGTVSKTMGAEAWHVHVFIENQRVRFKMDTGADVTVIPDTCVPRKKTPLQKSTKGLFGPGQNSLQVFGMSSSKMECKGAVTSQDVYVVKNLQEPLLGRPAIEVLHLIQRLESVQSTSVNYREVYPKLYSGLGRMKESYKIRLREYAIPYAVSAPRRVPLLLQTKVKMELEHLQDLDVIRQLTRPTDWCAPIEMKDAIRLCVDLTELNESVRRENYPLPSTDQQLAQLAGATVFTKLDCNSGFHQVPLDEDSQELTTFITPFGRFCFKRLPFGISSGPEVLYRIMLQLLSNIPGVICDIDDILVSGCTQQEHDQRQKEVLQRLEGAGVTLNDKCALSQVSGTFPHQWRCADGSS